jgi:hypothetical protein
MIWQIGDLGEGRSFWVSFSRFIQGEGKVVKAVEGIALAATGRPLS